MLRPGALRQGRRVDTGARQRAVEFLPPVCHVAGRAVAVEHRQRRLAERFFDKTCRRQLFIVYIAARDTGAGNVQLARNTGRNRR